MRRAAVLQLAKTARAAPTVYERAMQRIAIMNQTGYDAVWLAEHQYDV